MKKIILILGIICLTGCNKKIIDTNYEYNKAYCYYGNEKVELRIKTWKDYEDGEQIQIKTKEGKYYLVSANQCYLIGE